MKFVSVFDSAARLIGKQPPKQEAHLTRRVLDTNVMSAFSMVRHCAPSRLAQRRGWILFMASMTSPIGMPLVPADSAAKSAYMGMVRSMASVFGPALEAARMPMGRFGEPEYLCSPAAKFVDGGASIGV
jgi:NAD(P)-dependent dehydrogenase (short-subunit alcohol dehydrogenase family)